MKHKLSLYSGIAGALFGLSVPASAKPPFAEKEGVACTYCHTQAPRRNYRGDYYKSHQLSFAGFVDTAEAKKAGVPVAPGAASKPKSLTTAKQSPRIAILTKKAEDAEGAARSAPRDAKLRIAFAAALTKLGDAQLADSSVPLATRIDNANQSYTKAGHIDGKNTAAKAGLEKIKALQATLDRAKSGGRNIEQDDDDDRQAGDRRKGRRRGGDDD
ncbi:MAG: hypothetical protein ACKO14_05725 [Armatimonadota bacterium]